MTPSRFIRGVRNRFLFWVARQLKFYLAHTHLIWGDPSRVRVGHNVDLADAILNCRSGDITIEDDVFFGHGVLILAGTHDYHKMGPDRQNARVADGYNVMIHSGAWLASNVVIIGPCEIGADAVITAGTIVRGNVPPACVYGRSGPHPIFQIAERNRDRVAG